MDKKLVANASIVINASAARVWDALTNPEAIKVYMFGSTVISDWREGSDCREDAERARLMDSILLPMVNRNDGGPHIGSRLAGAIVAANGEISVARLCDIAGAGYKRLERSFLREVGVTPKLYARMIRFQRSASGLASAARKGQSLPDGYYDQSHFIREFKRFAGESPERFFRRRQQISSFLLERERASKLYNTAADL